MKLELKHIAPYLPYSMKYQVSYQSSFTNEPDSIQNKILSLENIYELIKKRYKKIYSKLILHPYSDLTKEIDINRERFVPIIRLKEIAINNLLTEPDLFIIENNIHDSEWYIIQNLLSWHFDVFNLIENNLAIDINTLK